MSGVPNPYDSPKAPGGWKAGLDAAEAVKLPAILLMVAGGIGVAMHLLGIVLNLLGVGMMAAGNVPDGGGADKGMVLAQGIGSVVGAGVGLGLDALVLYGALKMMNLQQYGLAMAASIVAMLPCISLGCCIGLPVGIWSIVVLVKPEVKSAFR